MVRTDPLITGLIPLYLSFPSFLFSLDTSKVSRSWLRGSGQVPSLLFYVREPLATILADRMRDIFLLLLPFPSFSPFTLGRDVE